MTKKELMHMMAMLDELTEQHEYEDECFEPKKGEGLHVIRVKAPLADVKTKDIFDEDELEDEDEPYDDLIADTEEKGKDNAPPLVNRLMGAVDTAMSASILSGVDFKTCLRVIDALFVYMDVYDDEDSLMTSL